MKILSLLKKALVGVLGLVVTVLAVVYGWSSLRMTRTYDVTPVPVAVSDDPATLAHGEHVATIRGCVHCHGEGLAGKVFMDAMPLARLWASNLTGGAGGVADAYRFDQDWLRAIRHGVAPDGSPLLFMPAQEARAMGPQDMSAVLSYIKSLPPVDNEPPFTQRVGPIGRALFLAGPLPLLPAELVDHDDRTYAQPPTGETVEYGAYMATICTPCHGENLSGGKVPGSDPSWPPAANLTPDSDTGIGSWTLDRFRTILASGRASDGRLMDQDVMPWPFIAQMNALELSALWLYLRSLEPLPKGTPQR